MSLAHLDTNILIKLFDPTTAIAAQLAKLTTEDWLFGCSAIAWCEFLNGPVNPTHISAVQEILQDRIAAFTSEHAQKASELFNLTERKRGSLSDCMIAASAFCVGADILTLNQSDFQRFRQFGVTLLEI